MSVDFNIFQALETNIIQSGLCKGCGACVLACDFEVIKMKNNKPFFIGKEECSNCGMCLHVCPAISKSNIPAGDGFLKPMFFMARSIDDDFRKSGNNLGVTNSIAYTALLNGIKSVRSLKAGKNILDIKTFNAYTKDDLLESSGSKFFLTPITVEIGDLKRQEIDSTVFIGLPCVLSSINLLQRYKYHKLDEIIQYKICLFCRGILDPKKFIQYLKLHNVNLEDISIIKFSEDSESQVSIDIQLRRSDEKIKVTEPELNNLIWEACRSCPDFYTDISDISIGWQGSPENWQTVIVFTKKGYDLLISAEKAKLIELQPLPENFKRNLLSFQELKEKASNLDCVLF